MNDIAIVFTTRHLEKVQGFLFSGCDSHYALSQEYYDFFTDWTVNTLKDKDGKPDEYSIAENKQKVAELRTYLTQTLYAKELQPIWEKILHLLSVHGLTIEIGGLSGRDAISKFAAKYPEILENDKAIELAMLDYIRTEKAFRKHVIEELKSSPKDVFIKLDEIQKSGVNITPMMPSINIDCKRDELKKQIVQLRFKIYELISPSNYRIFGLWGLGDIANDKDAWYNTIVAEIAKTVPECKKILIILHDKDVQSSDSSFKVIEPIATNENGILKSIAIFNHEDKIGMLLRSSPKSTTEIGNYIEEIFKKT